jgi:hypothetical protein
LHHDEFERFFPQPPENFMRLIAAFTASLLAQASLAFSQTADEVKGDILAALSTPLPITVIGPIITRDVKVVADGAGFVATLQEPMLMGIVPLKTMSFKLTPQGDKLYRITDFKLPSKLNVLNMVDIGIGETKFDGVWSASTRSYQTLGFQLKSVDVAPVGSNGGKVTIGALALDVAKEGEAGATESKFSLAASDVVAKGFPPNTVAVKSVVAELKADGENPVDLYSVLSRFVVLGAMQNDGDALLQFAESLRAAKYDSVVLNVAAKGVDVKGSDAGSKVQLSIADVGAVAGLKGVTPEEWGQFTFALDGAKIRDRGILGVADMNADSGSFVIDGARIPIGATLNAITTMQAISRGEAGVVRVVDILDGLLNMGGIKVTSSAKGISYLPDNKDDPTIGIDSVAFASGTEGFRDNKGRLFLSGAVDGVNVLIKSFPTKEQMKAYQLFNPKLIHYDLNISELNEQLLRKLMADVVISSEQDLAALAVPAVAYVMALKPMIETRDMRFQSAEVDVSTTGKLRFYPAWAIGAMPYEGETKLSVKGLDKVNAFLAELKDSGAADRAGMSMAQSIMGTFKALAVAEGDALNWKIAYPKAGEGLMVINDTEMRFPDLTATLMPLMMTVGMGNIFSSIPPAIDEAPAVEAPAEEAPVDEAVPAPMAEEPPPVTEEAVPAQ